ELIETGLGQKRRGSVLVTAGGDAFTGAASLYNFLPEQDPSLAELWLANRQNPPKLYRIAAGAASEATSPDQMTSSQRSEERRVGEESADVCSSDLPEPGRIVAGQSSESPQAVPDCSRRGE